MNSGSPLFHSDGLGYLQRAAGRCRSVRVAVWRERAQRRRGRGPVLVSLHVTTLRTNHESAFITNGCEGEQSGSESASR